MSELIALQENNSVKCPHCEKWNMPDAKICGFCGRDLYLSQGINNNDDPEQFQVIENQSLQKVESRVIGYKIGKLHSNMINCSECNFEQSEVYSACQKFGVKFSDD